MTAASRKSSLSSISLGLSAKVSRCEKCCFSFKLLYLHVINFIDFCLGIILITFAVYLYQTIGTQNFTNSQSGWVGWCAGSLGTILLLTAMLSLCASITPGYRWVIIPSNWLSVVAFIYSFSLGISSIVKQGEFYDYIEHAGLNSKQINVIKSWYTVMSIMFLGLSALELIRLLFSYTFRDQALRVDREFKALLLEEEHEFDSKLADNNAAREQKYKNLKDFYRNKYSTSNPLYSPKV